MEMNSNSDDFIVTKVLWILISSIVVIGSILMGIEIIKKEGHAGVVGIFVIVLALVCAWYPVKSYERRSKKNSEDELKNEDDIIIQRVLKTRRIVLATITLLIVIVIAIYAHEIFPLLFTWYFLDNLSRRLPKY
jgi:hypothetical protein